MANPAIKWTPKSGFGASEQTATFPRGLTAFRGLREALGNTAVSQGGKAVSVVHDAFDTFEVELRGISLSSDADFFARITAWWAHASQGGEWKFFLDSANTLDTTMTAGEPQGETTISVAATTSLAADDWLLLEDAADPSIWERAKASTVGATIVLAQGTAYSYSSGSVVRHAEYFPKCVATQQSSPLVERDGGGGNRWDFRLTFRTVR